MLRFHHGWYLTDTFTCIGIEPLYLRARKKEIEEYEKTHPYPKDCDYYDLETFIGDMRSEGLYTITNDVPASVRTWIEDCLNTIL